MSLEPKFVLILILFWLFLLEKVNPEVSKCFICDEDLPAIVPEDSRVARSVIVFNFFYYAELNTEHDETCGQQPSKTQRSTKKAQVHCIHSCEGKTNGAHK